MLLNSGYELPELGIGLYRSEAGGIAYQTTLTALKEGYRHVDTAALYGNEADVGAAIRDSGIPRDQIFVTTKLWNTDQAAGKTKQAFQRSLSLLGLDYLDLYLLHSPSPGKQARLKAWQELIELQQAGLVRSIGVSNFGIHHLKEFLQEFPNNPPAVNQLEVHPWLTRTDICEFCKEQGIVVVAYSPLAKARKMNDATLTKIAIKHQKTWAQVLVKWSLQKGYVVIPKSDKPDRIRSNAAVYDFELSTEDVAELDALNENYITGWDPTILP